MPSLLGTDVTTNYLKAAPTTAFGTRVLTILSIAQTGVETGYLDSNSLFSKTVRSIQQTAEVWGVGLPAGGVLRMIIATDTQSTADGYADQTAGFGLLEAAVLAGSGTAATITVFAL
jgi:hypothetical protein